MCSGRDDGAAVAHGDDGASPSVPVATSTQPPGTLWRTPFSTRLATRRSTSALSPVVCAASPATRTSMSRDRASVLVWRADAARDLRELQRLGAQQARLAAREQHEPVEQRLGARRRTPTPRRPPRAAPRRRAPGWRARPRPRCGSPPAACAARGSRWPGSGAGRRTRRARRSSMASSVSPSSRSSSGGPAGASRSPRRSSEIRRAKRVISSTGASARWASEPADRARDEQRADERDDVPGGEGADRVARGLGRQRAAQVARHEPQADAQQQRAAGPEEAGVQQREAGLDAQSR